MYFLINKKKYQKSFVAIFLLLVILVAIFWIKGERVSALSANYDKKEEEPLRISDWNELAEDFLAKSGGINGVMSGILDLGLSIITGVDNPSEDSDTANKSYVDSSLSSLGGGSVFTNWGRNDCPTGSEELYEGFAFGSEYNDRGGGNNIICLQAGGAGLPFSASERSLLQPLITVDWVGSFPPEIAKGSFISCAVCYNSNSNCYVKTNNEIDISGNWLCDGSYSVAYEGYLGGSIRTVGSNLTSRDRSCINRDLISLSAPSTSRGIVQGTRIDENLGLTDFTDEHFIRCSVCCN